MELVWKLLAIQLNQLTSSTIIEFKDVQFLRATAMPEHGIIELVIVLHQVTGLFEITENGSSVVRGTVGTLESYRNSIDLPKPETHSTILNTNEFYKELKIRGYHYSGDFQSVLEARSDGLASKIKWTGNWAPFLDCAMQLYLIGVDNRDLALPTQIKTIRINPIEHQKCAIRLDDNTEIFECNVFPELGILITGGVEISCITTRTVSRRRPPGNLILESYKFISYFESPVLELADLVRICVQLFVENNLLLKCKVAEIEYETSNNEKNETSSNEKTIEIFREVLSDIPLIISDLYLLSSQASREFEKIKVHSEHISTLKDCTIVIGTNLLSSKCNNANEIIPSISLGGYLLSQEDKNFCINDNKSINLPHLCNIAQFKTTNQLFVLYRKIKVDDNNPTIINISSTNKTDQFSWLAEIKDCIKYSKKTIIVAQNSDISGIVGLVNCLRKEKNGQNIGCVLIMDTKAPTFDYNNPFYKKQLNLNFAFNVYKNVSVFPFNNNP